MRRVRRGSALAVAGACAALVACDDGRTAVEPDAQAPVARTIVAVARDTTIVLGDSLGIGVGFTPSAGELRVALTLRNLTPRTVSVSWGGCGVSLSLFRTSDLTGSPAFDDRVQRACSASRTTLLLSAGATAAPGDLARQLPASRILAESLRVGRYVAAAQTTLGVGGLLLPAGAVELQR